ncbi:Uncharacterised protein [Legionella lansingensis]|uniref:Uncharacterized protein n=1 Tax=Legionella lansingensis TaxID=45067 RepID=A0A0W0VHJ5_9GAMM|nr:hypothetical protein [Legionella lansingensis]KTD19145.1 hypothetical protein Llan_2216 [Legionella lansingensis]SNV45497.1 Uncharacterised protein [Legionella lansingensis]
MAKFKTIGSQQSSTDFTTLSSFNLSTDVNARKKSYDAFQTNANLRQLTDQDRSAGVRVYSSLPEQDIRTTLSRKEGYAIPPAERYKTRERVIASKAHYIADSSGNFDPNAPVGVTMLTTCTPNLRRKPSGVPENPQDYKDFVKADGNLNDDAFRAEMKKVWTRYFFAANEEAKRTGKKVDIITPLIGAGAYLEDLPPSERQQAKRIIAETMIEAANSPSFQNIDEIHLSIPNGARGETDDFKLIEDVMSKSTSQKSITLSDTDMLTLGRQRVQSGKEITICNPGSDHVPGGGAYDDRDKPLKNGGHAYNQGKGADPNHPGKFNGHPKALEEQLGQVSNFLYIQNKDQNPQHFDFVKIPQSVVTSSAKPPAPPHQQIPPPLTPHHSPPPSTSKWGAVKTQHTQSPIGSTPSVDSLKESAPLQSNAKLPVQVIENQLRQGSIPLIEAGKTALDECMQSFDSNKRKEAADLIVKYAVKHVLGNLDTNVKVSMVDNRRAHTAGHDATAMKIQFNSDAEAQLFAKKLLNEYGVHSLTSGQGIMKRAQNGAIYLTKGDLEKIAAHSKITAIPGSGATAYKVMAASFEQAKTKDINATTESTNSNVFRGPGLH